MQARHAPRYALRQAIAGGALLVFAMMASAVRAEPVADEAAVLTIEGLKDSVVDRLAACETGGRSDPARAVVIDTNNRASMGLLQFQARTVVNYTRLIEGRAIDDKEAFRIALDAERASGLAKRIIFEQDGLDHWYACARKLRLRPEVSVIQSLAK